MTEVFKWLKFKTLEPLTLQVITGGNTVRRRECVIKTQNGGTLLRFVIAKNGTGIKCEARPPTLTPNWESLPKSNRRNQAEKNWPEWFTERNRTSWSRPTSPNSDSGVRDEAPNN